ncbi:MAG TPA: glycosyltransferase family 2 protein [Polyangia bacterium]
MPCFADMAASVSCVIMAYNEEATLEAATRDVHDALAAFGDRAFEILIVDDGSRDRTPLIAAAMAARYPAVRVITHPVNRGPGSAQVTGFRQARNDILCYHPADQQVDFREVAACIPLLDDPADPVDLIIARRSGRPGYSLRRLVSSYGYILLAQVLFGLRRFKDFNFIYLYRRAILDGMRFETQSVFFTTEVLVKAVARDARVREVTLTCLPRTAGEATCGRPAVILRTFADMMSFWAKWQLRGRR